MPTRIVAELEGSALDAAVARVEGIRYRFNHKRGRYLVEGDRRFSTCEADAEPVLARGRIDAVQSQQDPPVFTASGKGVAAVGRTRLIAAMRCHVRAEAGAEIRL